PLGARGRSREADDRAQRRDAVRPVEASDAGDRPGLQRERRGILPLLEIRGRGRPQGLDQPHQARQRPVRDRPRPARAPGRGAAGVVKQALGGLGGDSRPVSAEELGEAMAEVKGDAEPVEPAQVQKLLRQAHDRELIDLAKEDDGAYTVKVRDAAPPPPRAEPAAVTDADEALDPPMPESSAPPSMRPGASPTGGAPARRRGV